jgi:hypothetical protein
MVVASVHCEVTIGPVGGHISVGAVATLLSSHAGRSFDADKTHARQSDGGTQATSRTPGAQNPTTATAATHPDTELNLCAMAGALYRKWVGLLSVGADDQCDYGMVPVPAADGGRRSDRGRPSLLRLAAPQRGRSTEMSRG